MRLSRGLSGPASPSRRPAAGLELPARGQTSLEVGSFAPASHSSRSEGGPSRSAGPTIPSILPPSRIRCSTSPPATTSPKIV